MKFQVGHWWANGWMSIDIEPIDEAYFYPMLHYVITRYNLPEPRVIMDLDGCFANFTLLGSRVLLSIDPWNFSFGIEDPGVCKAVMADLQALPPDFFDRIEP